jgi:hypothetical protein
MRTIYETGWRVDLWIGSASIVGGSHCQTTHRRCRGGSITFLKEVYSLDVIHSRRMSCSPTEFEELQSVVPDRDEVVLLVGVNRCSSIGYCPSK